MKNQKPIQINYFCNKAQCQQQQSELLVCSDSNEKWQLLRRHHLKIMTAKITPNLHMELKMSGFFRNRNTLSIDRLVSGFGFRVLEGIRQWFKRSGSPKVHTRLGCVSRAYCSYLILLDFKKTNWQHSRVHAENQKVQFRGSPVCVSLQ